jgi:hypothetical protein
MIRSLIKNALANLDDLDVVQKVRRRTICGESIAGRKWMDLEISPDQYPTVQKPLKLSYLHNRAAELGG